MWIFSARLALLLQWPSRTSMVTKRWCVVLTWMSKHSAMTVVLCWASTYASSVVARSDPRLTSCAVTAPMVASRKVI